MMMNRTAASIAATLACALAAPLAGAQPAATGAPPKGAAMVYTLDAAGQSGVLLGAQGLTGSSTGAPAKPRVGALSEITLSAGTGLPPAFYAWVSAALLGRPMPFAATVNGVETSGRGGETASIANPRLIGVSFGALDQASHASMHMDVRMQAQLKIEPAKSPKLPRVDAHAQAARWLVSGYRLALGKLDTSHVPHIGAITLGPGTGAQLDLTTTGATAQAFARVAPTPKQRAARPVEDGELVLTGADGAPLATLVLQDVQVMSLYYGPPPPTGATRAAIVTILAKRADLKFAPAMSH
jgi:hypothetical protein